MRRTNTDNTLHWWHASKREFEKNESI